MNIKDYKNLMKQLIKTDIVPFVWGKKGIGKTDIHRQLADEMKMDLVYLTFGAVEDVGDIIGLMDFKEVNGVQTVYHVAPDWFPTEGNKLIVIDEFNRAKPQIMQAMFPFILEGKLHTHQLPENCKIIAIGNPPTDEYDVTDINDSALMSRFCHIELTPTFDEWAKFETSNNGNYDVISFFRENQEYLGSKAKEFDLKSIITPDRRNASKLSKFANLDGITDPQLRSVACGLLGTEIGIQFMQFKKDSREKLSAKDIFEKYDGSIGKKVIALENERDLLSKTLKSVIDLALAMKVTESFTTKQKTRIKNVELFLNDLPCDLAYKGCEALIKTGKKCYLDSIGESKLLIKKFTDEKK